MTEANIQTAALVIIAVCVVVALIAGWNVT